MLSFLHLSARPAARDRQPYGSRETGQRLTRNRAVSQPENKALITRGLIDILFLPFDRNPFPTYH